MGEIKEEEDDNSNAMDINDGKEEESPDVQTTYEEVDAICQVRPVLRLRCITGISRQ